MNECQICGRQASGSGTVEGARVPLCYNCSRYAPNFSVYKEYRPVEKKEIIKPDVVVKRNYSKLIREVREKQGLDRKHFAAKLQIQETELTAFEEGRIKPTIEEAKTLGYALGINLLEEEVDEEPVKTTKIGSATLGDFIKIKKKN
ncbi:TIGR00270 family protein [Candidatus Micrarchaeota archaeon]|nr:TIGR00270 family protein [Candidatus Micrarchaeota archaeon]